MATIHIDNQPHRVKDGQNLLQACLALGYDLPYFCWHPALGSVGACRQCTVKRFKNETDDRGELVMACMTPADDGTRISISDPEAAQFRASVVEWLMLNHPHDCPVCDEGGECHLQDMTVMTGHNYRRSRFAKRTHRNQNLGPFINHEMNRCIQCYRCVRFYRDYAGGTDLEAMACHDHVYFGRFGQGPLENPFSGNLVEICPTGVFTDKTLKAHYTRKWDLQTAPTICVHCGLGCNTITGERYGTLRRVRNRYHHQVNGYFLCDRGRYGYEFVNSQGRIEQPLKRENRQSNPRPATPEEARELAAAMLADPGKVIGIGSPRASLEDNFALRTLVGADRFYAGLADREHACLVAGRDILQSGPVAASTLQGMGLADAAVVLGEDVAQSAPLMALNLRRMRYNHCAGIAAQFNLPDWNDAAVREFAQLHKPPLFIAAPFPTWLDAEARMAVQAAPDDLLRLAYGALAILDDAAASVPHLDDALRQMAGEMARRLLDASRPLVITGTGCGRPDLIEAAANLAWCLKRRGRDASLAICVPEYNTMGLALMAPHFLEKAFQAVESGRADTVIVLKNDLYRRADAGQVDAMLNKARQILVLDSLNTPTTERADLVLPAATFAEASGTAVNNEGRAQRSHAVKPPHAEIRAAWRWLRDLMQTVGAGDAPAWPDLGAVAADLAQTLPDFGAVAELDPEVGKPAPGGNIPRQSHRYTGRTAMQAHIRISEPAPPEDADTPLAFSMEGYAGRPPAPLISRLWAPGWNSEQALNKFQSEIDGPLKGGDPGRRLIEPAAADHGRRFPMPDVQTVLNDDQYLLVPMHHIFGSEAQSMAAPAIAGRAPQPYVAVNPADAPVDEGRTVRVSAAGWTLELPIRQESGIPRRTVGIPVGLPGMPVVDGPLAITIAASHAKDGR